MLVWLSGAALLPGVSFGSNETDPKQGKEHTVSEIHNTYCGVYAAYRGLMISDHPTEFADLIKAEYIESRRGSTAKGLSQAIKENGAKCEVVSGMTLDMLIGSSSPIILHVRSDYSASTYNHWVLFTGVENGHALIADGANPVSAITFAELGARWDGTGIIIDESHIGRLTRVAQQTLPIAAFVCLWVFAIGMAAMKFSSSEKKSYIRQGMKELLPIVLLSVLIALFLSYFTPGGFISHQPAISQIQSARHNG